MLTRDPRLANELFDITDTQVLAKTDFEVHVPSRYLDVSLMVIGERFLIAGLHGLVKGDKYAVSNTCNLIETQPAKIEQRKFQGTEYHILHYIKGSPYVVNNNLFVDDVYTYYIFYELIFMGHCPWYVSNTDLQKILHTAQSSAGSPLGKDRVVTSIITSIISRNPKNGVEMYRHYINRLKDTTLPHQVTSLEAIPLTVRSTTSKMAGAYMVDGLVSSMNTPSDIITPIERAARE